MISRRLRGSQREAGIARIEHPEAIALAMALAAVAAFGWLASPFGLAVAVGLELAIGGLGAVWVLGPARAGLGLARYATLATAGVALTLFGRLLVDRAGLLMAPPAALLLWIALWAELDAARTGHVGLTVDLVGVGTVFAAASGVGALVDADAWPPGLILLSLLLVAPILRAAEARGTGGVWAVGQATLHLLAVAQVAAALALLRPPVILGGALVALTYHAWDSAASALEDGEAGWRVALEIGALGLMGLVLAFLVATG
jgi:hypothetical protein